MTVDDSQVEIDDRATDHATFAGREIRNFEHLGTLDSVAVAVLAVVDALLAIDARLELIARKLEDIVERR
jgi:hypothetical protein